MMKPFPDRGDEEIVEPPNEKQSEINFLLEREKWIFKEHENQKELLRRSQISERKLHREQFYKRIDPEYMQSESFGISPFRSMVLCPAVKNIVSGIDLEKFEDMDDNICKSPRLTFHDLYRQFQKEEESIISRHRSQMTGLESYHNRVLIELQKQISRIAQPPDFQKLRKQKSSESGSSKNRSSASPMEIEESMNFPNNSASPTDPVNANQPKQNPGSSTFTPGDQSNNSISRSHSSSFTPAARALTSEMRAPDTVSSHLSVDASPFMTTPGDQQCDNNSTAKVANCRKLNVPTNLSTIRANVDASSNLSTTQAGVDASTTPPETQAMNVPNNLNLLNPEIINLLNMFGSNFSANNQQTTVLLSLIGGLLNAQQFMMSNQHGQHGNPMVNSSTLGNPLTNNSHGNPVLNNPLGNPLMNNSLGNLLMNNPLGNSSMNNPLGNPLMNNQPQVQMVNNNQYQNQPSDLSRAPILNQGGKVAGLE
ncbi:10145_t:CDS:2, partial [Acaulospora colombiana]